MATQGVSLSLEPAELLRRLPGVPGTFLLDGGTAASWGTSEAWIGAEPTLVLTCDADGATRVLHGAAETRPSEDPFSLLQRLIPPAPDDGDADRPMSGVLCAVAYDAGRWLERLPVGPPDDLGLPVLVAAVHPWVLAYSYTNRHYTLRSRTLSAAELREVAQRLEALAQQEPPVESEPSRRPEVVSNFTKATYLRTVRRALEYIAAGDIYQVNLAQRFTTQRLLPARTLFARLLAQHPAPYAAYVDCGSWSVVSNSPECLLQRDGDAVATFPIKGTRPRGRTAEDDARLVADLRRSPKDGAEHVMIVDLERNDLGRVCRAGTVGVRALARVCSLPTLHHLESEVRGTLRPATAITDVLRATFPGGSITGTPKIRAMEIIDELEPVARRFYTGAVGFIDGEDWARFNIAIRTAIVTESTVAYHTGGGIVADSVPEQEYDETLLKARAFLTALQVESP